MPEGGHDQRKVGVEIEFAGCDVPTAARLVADTLGGEMKVRSRHVATVEGSRIGRLELELDTRYAKPPEDDGLIDRTLERLHAREGVADILSLVAPVELVTEPLDPDELIILDEAVHALCEAGLEGTRTGALNAFGLHLNIQLVPLDRRRLVRIAGAYAFAEDWLRETYPPDTSRRVTPFIAPYPSGYRCALAHAMEGGAVPAVEDFIRLYAEWNPTPNRGLDMWKILGHLEPGACEAALGKPVKNPRPAFHYRLPDSRVDEPDWSPRRELERWDRVEAAADDPEALERLRRACLDVETWRIDRDEYRRTVARVIG